MFDENTVWIKGNRVFYQTLPTLHRESLEITYAVPLRRIKTAKEVVELDYFNV